MSIDVSTVRDRFPALRRIVHAHPAAYVVGPGGTAVPESVIDAVAGFMRDGSSDHGGPFVTSRETDAVAADARIAAMGCMVETVASLAVLRVLTGQRRMIDRLPEPGVGSSNPPEGAGGLQ